MVNLKIHTNILLQMKSEPFSIFKTKLDKAKLFDPVCDIHTVIGVILLCISIDTYAYCI